MVQELLPFPVPSSMEPAGDPALIVKSASTYGLGESTLPHGHALAFSTASIFSITTTSLPSYLGERIFSHPMGE
jgi:hypothetical protein